MLSLTRCLVAFVLSSRKKIAPIGTGASSRQILRNLMNASSSPAPTASKSPSRARVQTRTKGVSTATTMADMETSATAAEALQQSVSALEVEKTALSTQLEQMTKRKADWEAEGEASLKQARVEAAAAQAELELARAAEARALEQTEEQTQKVQAIEMELQAARDGLTGSDEQKDREVSAARAQADELRTELQEATAGRNELERQLAATKAEMEAANEALEAQRAAVASSSALEQGLQQDMEEAKIQIEQLRRESMSESEAASEAQARIEAMAAELAAESERHVAASQRLSAMTAEAAAAEAAHAESLAALTAQLDAQNAVQSQTETKLEHAERMLAQATRVTVAQAAHVRALAVVGQGMAANPIEDPRTPEAIRRILRPEEGDEATAEMAIEGEADTEMAPAGGAPLVSSQQQLMTDVQGMATAVNQLREALEEQQAQNGMLVANNAKLQEAADAAEAAEAAAKLAGERQRAAEARAQAAEDTSAKVQERLATEERLRVHLHNLIQQLKGNIRVCVRVRPMLGDEATKAADCHELEQLSFPDDLSVEVSRAQATVTKTVAKKNLFTYDKTFNSEASQEMVFGEVSEFVQSAIDGKRVCVFCYGITGSGKTYTMGTDVGDLSTSATNDGAMPESAGIVPRTIKLLMDTLATDQSAQVTTTCLEVYNEQIRDLFSEKKKESKKQTQARECSMPGVESKESKSAAVLAAKKKKAEEEHKVDPKTGEISNLVAHSFGSSDRAALCSSLESALSGRSVSATNCNEVSSRSHTVLTIKIKRKTEHGTAVDGELNLVDLAGSERIALSGVTGDRQKETQAINASLSALGDVVSQVRSPKLTVGCSQPSLHTNGLPCYAPDELEEDGPRPLPQLETDACTPSVQYCTHAHTHTHTHTHTPSQVHTHTHAFPGTLI